MCQLLSEAEETRNMADSGGDKKLLEQDPDSKPAEIEDTGSSEPSSKDAKSLKLPVFIPSTVVTKVEAKIDTDDTLHTEDIDDEELDREYLLQPREIMLKAAIWFKANAEHLEQSRKRKLAQQQKQQEQEDIKGPKKRKSASRRNNNYSTSTTRMNRNMISKEEETKPLSRKINYEALEAIVGLPTPSSSAQSSNNDNNKNDDVIPTDVDHITEPRPGPLLASTLCDNDNSKELYKSAKPISVNKNQNSLTNSVSAVSMPTDKDRIQNEHLNKANGRKDDNDPGVNDDDDDDDEAVEEDEENNKNDPYDSYLPNYSHGVDDDDEDWSNGAELW
ncbi:unnamed protein product [Heterobilharzia americana]|nr:unnamed protein product [Heterobilharzia americana]